jgi:ubiquinone/menaquinone biosynthesis C-methylase UbiE
MKRYPKTIDNAWGVLYRDYPEVYDAFSSFTHDPRWIDVVGHVFPLAGKVVADIGSGTGESSFALAEHAAYVVGVEPEAAMRAVAEEARSERQLTNVTFTVGSAGAIPLADESVDVVIAVTAPLDVAEALRVLRPGGLVLCLDIAPDWYGGELNEVINVPTPDITERNRQLLEEWGFSYLDYDAVQEYGSTTNIVGTYGFIFGQKAIDRLERTGQTAIRWRFRIHHRHK